jgi:hypothetical protein
MRISLKRAELTPESRVFQLYLTDNTAIILPAISLSSVKKRVNNKYMVHKPISIIVAR